MAKQIAITGNTQTADEVAKCCLKPGNSRLSHRKALFTFFLLPFFFLCLHNATQFQAFNRMKPGEFGPILPFIFQVCLLLYLNHNILRSHKKNLFLWNFQPDFQTREGGSNKLGSISKRHVRFWMFIWSNLDSWPFEVPPISNKENLQWIDCVETYASASEWMKIPPVTGKTVSEHTQWNQALSRSIDTLLLGKGTNQSGA